MSDPWVLVTQQWLNATYGSHPQFEEVDETGRTGWPTMWALTRALQIELGFGSLSDSFGPGTFAAVDAIAPIDDSTANKNIIRIIQGAMYCKGYDGGGGDLDGDYSQTTISGVRSLRSDIGLAPSTGFMTPKVLKALLTMDAYTLVDGGSADVRAIQRALNNRYLARAEFYVIPADGYYSRGVQRAIMYAIQYEIDMDDDTANGNFGPGTQSGIRTLGDIGIGDSDSISGNFLVHLFQAALTFNGFPVPFDGAFSLATSGAVTSFQAFSALDVNGRGDFQTWASLLVSTGDVSRPGTAADTIRTITPERAQTLVANGYQTVGRYLTNSPVADPLDKNIKAGELQDIFAAGLTVVPIFQEGGDYLEYFDMARGVYAGEKAFAAARDYGFKRGATIYFAVDFDAVEDEVLSNVVPYFQGIKAAMANNGDFYRIGVYGARNTCSIVSARGLAELSYVSDMSTGYSGNLGFKLPNNWAFDQILEYEIGSGSGWVNIDKNVKSGRDAGQSSIQPPPLRLDVNVPVSPTVRAQLVNDVAAELEATMNPAQLALSFLSRVQAATLALEHDELITRLARAYNMRKAFIQTVLVWESAVVRVDDEAVDALVQATYDFHFGKSLVPPLIPTWDSSTGVCQIKALTAIDAINWGNDAGRRLTNLPDYSPSSNDDVWLVWDQLKRNAAYNIQAAALVLLRCADAAGLGAGELLDPSQNNAFKVLAKYNGDDDYGTLHLPLWNIFEAHNLAARGV